MPANKVFGMAIGHLKNDLLHTLAWQGTGLSMENIHWVLPVPTTWTVSAKEFMREAAKEAGIDRYHLTIIHESKAAAMYCQPHGNVDSKHVVIDIGDERVNITVLKNESDGTMNVIYTVSDRSMGGSKVNESYNQMIREIIGAQTFKKFCDENKDGHMEILKELESKKRKIRSDTNEKITLTAWDAIHNIYEERGIETLTNAIQQSRYRGQIECVGDKLRFDADLFRSLFHKTISKITTGLADILDRIDGKGITAILMVGRYSDCQLMQDAIKKAFPYIKITIPKEGDLTALKGAVIFGHSPMLTSHQDEDDVSTDDIANLSTYSSSYEQGFHHDQAENMKYKSLGEEEEELSSTPAMESQLENQMTLKADIVRAPSDEELFKLSRKLDKLNKGWWLLAKLLGLSDEKIDEMEHGGGDSVRQ